MGEFFFYVEIPKTSVLSNANRLDGPVVSYTVRTCTFTYV